MTGRQDELRETIVATHQELLDTLDRMTPEDMLRPSPNEGWSAKDTLAHLCSIEERLRGQIQSVLDGAPFPTEDVNVYNARKVAERRDWTLEQLRDELTRERATTLALLDSLSEAQLASEFDHPRRGRVPLASIFETIPNHMRTHTQDLEATRGGA